MFTAELYDFQEKHEENLLLKCADYDDIVLCAPTGSGKTVLACKFIDDYLSEKPDTIFMWLCPGAGSLHEQSQDSFNTVTSGIQDGDVYNFLSDPDPRGKVFFINWDKITKKSSKVLKESEEQDLLTKIELCHNKNEEFFLLIDEEHRFHDAAEKFISIVKPEHVLRISATPVTPTDQCETILENEVINAGLIAKQIVINEGVGAAVSEYNNMDDDLMLLELADKKRKAIQAEYDALGLNIRPLVLIQFPNGSAEWIERIKNKLTEMGYPESSGLVSSWFSGEHPENPEEIKKIDGHYAFMLFKQAIATGWDCPRAKILVKLREGGTESFNIQTIGRIRRMPERKHYASELLDCCYLYTLDKKFNEGLIKIIDDPTFIAKKKASAPNIILQKESLNGSDRYAVDPMAVVKVIKQRMLDECDLDHNGVLERSEMEISKGYVFGTILKSEALVGTARTTHDIKKLNKIFAGEHELNSHDDGFVIRDAKRRIARAIGVDEHISNNALKILFGPEEQFPELFSLEEVEFERENKLLPGMTLREYNAFLVNNRDRLVEVFSNVSCTDFGEILETDIKIEPWSLPIKQVYKKSKIEKHIFDLTKNMYSDYDNSVLVYPNRTMPEIEFERWCENNRYVKSYYKNGDKGDDFFSLVYRMAFRRSNFYPDYIVEATNGDIWIIETKGGEDSYGNTQNIDSYAERKFNALKEYAGRVGNVKFGFVRPRGMLLFISTTKWDEKMKNRKCWRYIDDVFKEETLGQNNQPKYKNAEDMVPLQQVAEETLF